MMGPYIKILEQPQSHARFRYGSEGEHGYLYGEKSTRILTTYPTVQLVNYKGEVHIRCELYQSDRDEKHPHQLKFQRQEDQIDYLVPVNGSYTVIFEKLGFINKSKNSFIKELREKYKAANLGATKKEMNKCCQKEVKSIDFNKVRLRFSAHDVKTDEEICHVYSKPILNSKSADTNELRIVRVSKTHDFAGGCEETMLLVEKISNTHTKVRFRDEKGEWTAVAHPIYKHHQFAIVCSIPPYKEQKITQNVQVFIELFRETDGATSNPIPFTYKRRMAGFKRPSATSGGESSAQNVSVSPPKIKKIQWTPQVCHVPISQEFSSTNLQIISKKEMADTVISQDVALPGPAENDQKNDSTGQNSDTDSGIQENLNDSPTYSKEDIISFLENFQLDALMQCPSEENSLPAHSVDDEEFPILHKDPVLTEAAQVPSFTACPAFTQPSDMELFRQDCQTLDASEYFGSDTISEMPLFQKLKSDSAQRRGNKDSEIENPSPLMRPKILNIKASSKIPNHTAGKMFEGEKIKEEHEDSKIENLSNQPMRPKLLNIKESLQVPKNTDGKILGSKKIKELVQDIIALIKQNGPRIDLQTKCESLFELDLPNGDTFLHMAINRPIFHDWVNILHAVNMVYLMNKPNDLGQTALHLAVLNELADTASLLVSKGCDPMLADVDGNNAIHLAVTSFPTLQALFDAMAANKVPYDVNATNYEYQTALHVATIYNCEDSLRLLLRNGADVGARDRCGRGALQLAASRDRAAALGALLDYMDAGDIDATDSRGHTALQTACDSEIRENTLAIVQLLLEAKADPKKCEGSTVSAMKLAKRHPEMRQIIQRYQYKSRTEDSGDEYHTADEGENGDFIACKQQSLKLNTLKIN